MIKKLNVKTITFLLIASLLLCGFIGFHIGTSSFSGNLEDLPFYLGAPQPYTYLIDKNSTHYFVFNGTTGAYGIGTNLSSIILDCVDSISAYGGSIVFAPIQGLSGFPDAYYVFDTMITVDKVVNFVGQARYGTFLTYTAIDGTPMFNITVGGVQFQDIRFAGQGKASGAGDGFTLNGVGTVKFFRVIVRNFKYGIHVIGASLNNMMFDLSIELCERGIFFEGTSSSEEPNDNHPYQCEFTECDYAVWIENAHMITLENCEFEHCLKHTVVINGTSMAQTTLHRIRDCWFEDNTNDDPSSYYNIYVTSSWYNVTDIVLEGNNFAYSDCHIYLSHCLRAKVRDNYCPLDEQLIDDNGVNNTIYLNRPDTWDNWGP